MSNITAVIIGNGTTSPILPQVVADGDTLLVNFLPDPGWSVGDVKVNEVSLGPVTSFTVGPVFSDYEFEITFTEDTAATFEIDVQDNVFGIISPGGIITVPGGNDQTVTFVPSSGYKMSCWLVDGVPADPATSYTFSNVLANHTIGVEMVKSIVYRPRPKLLKVEPFTIKRRNFDRGSYDTAGYRNQGPLFQTFQLLGNKQPGQTQSGILQAVGEQVNQENEYDYINKSWKIFTYDTVIIKDIFVMEDGEYEVLDVDDWSSYKGLNSLNFRSMARRIKSRRSS